MTRSSPRRRDVSHSNNPAFEVAASVVLLPFGRESYLRAAAERYDAELVDLGETTDRIVYRLRGTEVPVTLIYSGAGGPAAANALEMAAANGAQQIVLLGACGGVDPMVAVGELIVASGAVRGEGTSKYYAPIEFPAVCDETMTRRLWALAEAQELPAHHGLLFTTDASYRQGPEVYDAYCGMLLGVDCECATAAVVARRLGLALGTLLFCTDNVTAPTADDRRYRGLSEPRISKAFDSALGIAVAVLAATSQESTH